MMDKKLQILLFYLVLILASVAVTWYFSKDKNKMVNSLGVATIATGVSVILWQNYGSTMVEKLSFRH